MERIRSLLQKLTADALSAEFGLTVKPEAVVVQTCSSQHNGDYTVVLFPFLKHKLGTPEEVGHQLGTRLMQDKSVDRFEVVKGFLNISLDMSYWLHYLNTGLTGLLEGQDLYRQEIGAGKRVMVEFSSPNTNKPLHLGHLRNIFLGWSISKILETAGYEVIKANLINDRGIHICKSMLAYERFAAGELPSEQLKGDHLVGKYYVKFSEALKEQVGERAMTLMALEDIAPDEAKRRAENDSELMKAARDMLAKWEQGDPHVRQLWNKLNGWVYDGFEATYQKIGVSFDKLYYESDTYLLGRHIVEQGLSDDKLYQQEDGSVWCDLEPYGLDHKLLLRADGTTVYMTQDLGTAELKFQEFDPLERSLYVIGNEQDYHMQALANILDKLGYSWARKIHHVSYGMVELTTGKMKSREGTVVDADELVADMATYAAAATAEKGAIDDWSDEQKAALHDQLALGALKYYLLKVDPHKRMVFDPAESISFEGNTGVYLQYNHARLSAILRTAAERKLTPQPMEQLPSVLPAERALMGMLLNWHEVVGNAATLYAPSLIAGYAYDLVRAFSSYYAEVRILTDHVDEGLQFRLNLVYLVRATLAKALELLGIEAPERM